MDINTYIFGGTAVLLLLIVLLRRIFREKNFFKRYTLQLDGALFAICLLLIGFHFYKTRQRMGILAVAMGGAAIGKYLYDKRRDENEEN